MTLNVATLVGHNSVRRKAMGGSFIRPPSKAQLKAMVAMVDQAMRDGAVGLSTGLIYNPGTFARRPVQWSYCPTVHRRARYARESKDSLSRLLFLQGSYNQ